MRSEVATTVVGGRRGRRRGRRRRGGGRGRRAVADVLRRTPAASPRWRLLVPLVDAGRSRTPAPAPRRQAGVVARRSGRTTARRRAGPGRSTTASPSNADEVGVACLVADGGDGRRRRRRRTSSDEHHDAPRDAACGGRSRRLAFGFVARRRLTARRRRSPAHVAHGPVDRRSGPCDRRRAAAVDAAGVPSSSTTSTTTHGDVVAAAALVGEAHELAGGLVRVGEAAQRRRDAGRRRPR